MKTLLDSVHGTIEIPKELFGKVIDTQYFQRLRRIEQNSCRSVYPSARHDRFIHSIGVYHLGTRIADTIYQKCGPAGEAILPENAKIILDTYKLACLLHDIGHSPFSHTFEGFFDYDIALTKLQGLFNDENFNADIINSKTRAAEHEVISAFMAVSVFRKIFQEDKQENKYDWILLARMITGFRYLSDAEHEHEPLKSFENVMIELIHGEIIDADGLDYVCRDVWAGGYRTFNIDLNRLIKSVYISRDNSGNYSVSYSSKALNEIETVLNVKNFQYLYVIKHHKVLLEQYYLVEAMKSAACFHQNIDGINDDVRDNALRLLCDIDIFMGKKQLKRTGYTLFRPTDDDFITLMKLIEPEDSFAQQWFSRRFSHTPIWKSKLEYFNIFRPVLDSLADSNEFDINKMIQSKDCKNYLCSHLGLNDRDVITIGVKSRLRRLDATKINVRLNEEVIPYSKLNHDSFSVIGAKHPFCYMYVNMDNVDAKDVKLHKRRIVALIKDFLLDQLRDHWNGRLLPMVIDK